MSIVSFQDIRRLRVPLLPLVAALLDCRAVAAQTWGGAQIRDACPVRVRRAWLVLGRIFACRRGRRGGCRPRVAAIGGHAWNCGHRAGGVCAAQKRGDLGSTMARARRDRLRPGRIGFVLFFMFAKQPGKQASRWHRLRHIGHHAPARGDFGASLLIAGERAPVRGEMNGLAIREKPRELVVAHARPSPHAADVKVNEIRTRIPTDAAVLQTHADFANSFHRHAGHGRIHRPAQDMLRVFGDAVRAAAQHRVGLRRAVGRNNHDRLGCSGGPVGLPDHVEQARIHPGAIVIAPIAQEPIELFENRRIIGAVDAEGRLDRFAGMGMIEVQRAGVAVGGRRLGRGRNDDARQQRRYSGCGNETGISDRGRAAVRFSQVKSRGSDWMVLALVCEAPCIGVEANSPILKRTHIRVQL